MTVDHHPHVAPPIPFTETEIATMYDEDKKAGWDIARLACPGGITDPHLRIPPG